MALRHCQWIALSVLTGLFVFVPRVHSGFAAGPEDRPNIVVILADDLGWSDLGCYGADLLETPHIDQLAREGVRFSKAYAMPVCSPTRATLLTGKHAARVHMTIWSEGVLSGPRNRKLLEGASEPNLTHHETTIAKRLQGAGYLTALVGKWHLGDAEHFPEIHGFDVNIGGTQWGAPHSFFWPYRGAGRFGPEYRFVPHLEFGKVGEYLTDRLTDEALKVIERAGDRPFFLYLAHHAVHTPMEAKAADIAHFKQKLVPGLHHQNAVYAAMVKSLDESVGRILKALHDTKRDRNTLVVFASDNGGYIGIDRQAGQNIPVTNNAPLRSGKGSCYEGGIRVPLIVRWPGVTPAAAVCEEPVILTDLFFTLASAARVEIPPDYPGDGLNLSPLLKDPSMRLERDALFFHYPHYYETSTPVSAVRAGPWKLLEYFEDSRLELYNLDDDLGERHNLAGEMPVRAEQLRARLHGWRQSVDARLPTPNPAYKPKK